MAASGSRKKRPFHKKRSATTQRGKPFSPEVMPEVDSDQTKSDSAEATENTGKDASECSPEGLDKLGQGESQECASIWDSLNALKVSEQEEIKADALAIIPRIEGEDSQAELDAMERLESSLPEELFVTEEILSSHDKFMANKPLQHEERPLLLTDKHLLYGLGIMLFVWVAVASAMYYIGGGIRAESLREARTKIEVSKALEELQLLHYEESVDGTFLQAVYGGDRALAQTVKMLGLDTRQTHWGKVEQYFVGEVPYLRQSLRVAPPCDQGTFIKHLKSNLASYAPSISLEQITPGDWRLSTAGAVTHTLTFTSGKEVPYAPGSVRRKPGEPALMVIVVDDLGMGMSPVERLLKLSYPVTMAFWPHGTYTSKAAKLAHRHKVEILAHIPMEPMGYPKTNPGPGALLISLSAQGVRDAAISALNKVPFAIGLNNHMGSRFTQNDVAVRALLAGLPDKKLLLLDSVTHNRSVFYREAKRMGFTSRQRDIFLDHKPDKAHILLQLRTAEQRALQTGKAIAIGHPYPQTLEVLEEWQHLRSPLVKLVRLQDLPQ